MYVECSKCGHIAPEEDFPKGYDFFQNPFIKGCANEECRNHQSPGDASMRMFGGERPFKYVRNKPLIDDAIVTVMHNATDAS